MNQQTRNRNKEIIRCSLIGIGMNLVLSISKIITGSLIHSHAIMMDGFNSLLDMATSLISLLFATLSGRNENRNHPFGFGRLEYLGSMLVTMLVLYFGVRTAVESVHSILHPHEAPSYGPVTIIIMVISLVAKLIYGFAMKKRGKQLHSDALVISAVDSLADALISAGILAAIGVIKLTGLDIEHYICILISLLILRTGVRMICSNLTKMIGTSTDPALRKKLLDLIIREDGVLNVSGIVLHNYGEGNDVGSVSIEVDERATAAEISRISRRIIKKSKEIGIQITSVGITGTNISDPEAAKIWDTIISFAETHKSIRRVNSFVLDPEHREISFYVIPDYNIKRQMRNEELDRFEKQVRGAFPEMTVEILQGIDA